MLSRFAAPKLEPLNRLKNYPFFQTINGRSRYWRGGDEVLEAGTQLLENATGSKERLEQLRVKIPSSERRKRVMTGGRCRLVSEHHALRHSGHAWCFANRRTDFADLLPQMIRSVEDASNFFRQSGTGQILNPFRRLTDRQ